MSYSQRTVLRVLGNVQAAAVPTWLAFSPAGNELAIGGPSTNTVIWDLKRDLAACRIIPPRDSGGVFTPRDSELLLASALNGSVRRCVPKHWEDARLAITADGAAGAPRVVLYEVVVPGGHLDVVWRTLNELNLDW